MTFPDMCRCDSEFGDDILGYVHSVNGIYATIRLELDEDHSAMRDARADGLLDSEHILPEFIAIVPLSQVRTLDGDPWRT